MTSEKVTKYRTALDRQKLLCSGFVCVCVLRVHFYLGSNLGFISVTAEEEKNVLFLIEFLELFKNNNVTDNMDNWWVGRILVHISWRKRVHCRYAPSRLLVLINFCR